MTPVKLENPIPRHVHGTTNGYSNWRCRCDACREANTVACATRQRERRDRPVPEHIHGTDNGYVNYGCRCRPCTDAVVMANAARVARRKARAS